MRYSFEILGKPALFLNGNREDQILGKRGRGAGRSGRRGNWVWDSLSEKRINKN